MSGLRHRFANFKDIPLRSITAADKHSFSAMGIGDVYISVPNGKGQSTRVLLEDVLYAPSMGVTLVSISRIAASGSRVVFEGTGCKIYNKDHVRIGAITTYQGLYRTYTLRSSETAATTSTNDPPPDVGILDINELHRRLGHVLHEAARKLVEKGLVEGVQLDKSVKAVP